MKILLHDVVCFIYIDIYFLLILNYGLEKNPAPVVHFSTVYYQLAYNQSSL